MWACRWWPAGPKPQVCVLIVQHRGRGPLDLTGPCAARPGPGRDLQRGARLARACRCDHRLRHQNRSAEFTHHHARLHTAPTSPRPAGTEPQRSATFVTDTRRHAFSQRNGHHVPARPSLRSSTPYHGLSFCSATDNATASQCARMDRKVVYKPARQVIRNRPTVSIYKMLYGLERNELPQALDQAPADRGAPRAGHGGGSQAGLGPNKARPRFCEDGNIGGTAWRSATWHQRAMELGLLDADRILTQTFSK